MSPRPFTSGDKHVGLFTAFAVLVVVVYAKASYDVWDFMIGLLGLALAAQYSKDLLRNDRLGVILVSCISALAGATVLFSARYLLRAIFLDLPPENQLTRVGLGGDFAFFAVFFLVICGGLIAFARKG